MAQDPPPADSAPAELTRSQVLVKRMIFLGWSCLFLSAVFLYLSKQVGVEEDSANIPWALLLMSARLCGLTSFAIGGLAIYNGKWTTGVLMLLFSVVLPVVAFVVHGAI